MSEILTDTFAFVQISQIQECHFDWEMRLVFFRKALIYSFLMFTIAAIVLRVYLANDIL